jgi:hypothetical protein
MKMLLRTILSIVLIGFCLVSTAQMGKNNSIGLQLNPFLDEPILKGDAIKPVFALRYTFNIKDHISLGPELSGYFIRGPIVGPVYKSSNFNIGGFLRYSFLPESRVKPFFELSTYYTFLNYKQHGLGASWTSGSDSYLSGYFAPGISLFSKSRKFSVDIFYKFSNKDLVNGKQSVLSYRLNFRF